MAISRFAFAFFPTVVIFLVTRGIVIQVPDLQIRVGQQGLVSLSAQRLISYLLDAHGVERSAVEVRLALLKGLVKKLHARVASMLVSQVLKSLLVTFIFRKSFLRKCLGGLLLILLLVIIGLRRWEQNLWNMVVIEEAEVDL